SQSRRDAVRRGGRCPAGPAPAECARCAEGRVRARCAEGAGLMSWADRRPSWHTHGMTTLKNRLQEDLTAAIRSRDELRSSTLRLTLTAITKEEVSGTSARELSDDEVQKVIAREAKKRRESADAFEQGGRTE